MTQDTSISMEDGHDETPYLSIRLRVESPTQRDKRNSNFLENGVSVPPDIVIGLFPLPISQQWLLSSQLSRTGASCIADRLSDIQYGAKKARKQRVPGGRKTPATSGAIGSGNYIVMSNSQSPVGNFVFAVRSKTESVDIRVNIAISARLAPSVSHAPNEAEQYGFRRNASSRIRPLFLSQISFCERFCGRRIEIEVGDAKSRLFTTEAPENPGRHSRQPNRATARNRLARSRWSLDFVKKLTMFEVRSPGGNLFCNRKENNPRNTPNTRKQHCEKPNENQPEGISPQRSR